jgi:hypothetical protein
MDDSDRPGQQRDFPVKAVVWIGRASIIVGIVAAFTIIISVSNIW